MAKCDICGKAPTVGNRVSHANNRTKRRWLPNVQRINALVNGKPQKVTICSKCLRSNRAVKNPGNLYAQKAATTTA